jgi:hemoglobin/transferrin/lactoferrin receptor protein
MIWRMHQLQLNDKNRTGIYDESRLIIAYQDYDESRIDRTRENNFRHIQSETVKAYSLNWDALKTLNKGELYYGLEALHNRVGSFGAQTNIINGNILPFVSRYPDGSTVSAAGMYASYKLNISEKITITTGLRLSYNMLDASFDTSFIKFPYDNIKLREAAPTGNFGMVYRPAPTWQINANISTGFRMPNIDDIGKFFESVPGSGFRICMEF